MRYYYKSLDGKSYLNVKDKITDENYVEITEEEFLAKENYVDDNVVAKNNKHTRIIELKSLLRDSDYKAIKHFEGLISDEEYEPIKQQRIAWRNEINQLEN